MRNLMVVVAVLALAGCSVFQANPNPDAVQRAINIGGPVGDAACRAAIHKQPTLAPKLAKASAKGIAVLVAPDPTMAGLQEAINAVGDADIAFYSSLGIGALQAGLAGANIDTRTIDPGSPFAAGLNALFVACAKVAGGVA